MRVALDTNRYSDFIKGESTVAEVLESADEIVMPFVVVGELRAGFAAGTRGQANETLLRDFLREHNVRVVFADAETLDHYARLFGELSRAGKRIPSSDLWIAAIVLQHGLALCSRDSHFDHLPRILRV
ncbi:MAG: type II toxin-antitoxin system VapC family toxin [Phycisphaerales bacterium]|nr:type II toxin-antitoxin system VapC family toxin [Phycisphaerales bacterium]